MHAQGVVAAGLATADTVGVARVLTAHGNEGADTPAAYGGVSGLARAALRDRFARYVVEHVDVVVGSHPDWRVNLPIQPRRFSHIPNIVDDAFFTIHRRANSSVVLFVGGQRAIKGWPVLAAAWPAVKAAISHARLIAAGWLEGPRPLDVDPTVRDSISYEGTFPANQLVALMAEPSVLAIPSLFEVAPVILAEAWAMRLPVVAGAVGGIPGLASGAAALVPPGSASKLAERLIGVLRGYAGLDALAAEGCRRAESHSSRAVGAKHLSLYSELLREHG